MRFFLNWQLRDSAYDFNDKNNMRDRRTDGASSMTSGNILWVTKWGVKWGVEGGRRGATSHRDQKQNRPGSDANAMWEPEHVCLRCILGSHSFVSAAHNQHWHLTFRNGLWLWQGERRGKLRMQVQLSQKLRDDKLKTHKLCQIMAGQRHPLAGLDWLGYLILFCADDVVCGGQSVSTSSSLLILSVEWKQSWHLLTFSAPNPDWWSTDCSTGRQLNMIIFFLEFIKVFGA